MKLPKATKVSIDKIKPYSNNPREITPEAVEAVRRSIEEFGYVQPLVVDTKNVIIAGHTRFEALRELGVTEVDVYRVKMSEEQARKYRLVDNRTHELTDWAHDKLIAELREWEGELLQSYFADIDLDIGQASASSVTEAEIEQGAIKAATITQAPPVHMTDVKCPACLAKFQVKTTTLPGLAPEDIDDLLSG